MTPDGVHSYDRPRVRAAPTELRGTWFHGETVALTLEGLTIVVAVKPNCDGCAAFVHSPLDELARFKVIVVSGTDEDHGEWSGALQPVLVSPEALVALDIRWPPFYVVIDPAQALIVGEGVVFGPTQVAEEAERYLTT